MKKINTDIKDLIIIQNKKYDDDRGYFKEIFKKEIINRKFPFIVMSYSKKNVIRGLHLQKKNPQGKYITVIKGKIYSVVVDLRKKSKTFGKKFNIILSEKNSKSLFVPPGFANGFCALEKHNYIVYGCTKPRDIKNEIGINYNDTNLKINWPTKKPIISKKDKNNLTFKKLLKLI